MRDTMENMFKRLDSQSDVLTQVLESVGLSSALSSRVDVAAPWALHYGRETGHRAGFHIALTGSCLVIVDDSDETISMAPGDVVVFPHGTGHRIASGADVDAVEVHAIAAHLAPGEAIALAGDDVPTETQLLCGSYSFGPEGANPLLRGLPDVLHIPAGASPGLNAAVTLLAAESTGQEPGSAMVLDRLVNLLFVLALRAWMAGHEEVAGASWFGALVDPVVGPAVRAVHADPAAGWTVERLASHANLSRAAFSRRFGIAVGESPLAYVTRWRMTVAAELLAEGERVAGVAVKVGYENEFAFAKAFKRVRGVPPGQYRLRAIRRALHQIAP